MHGRLLDATIVTGLLTYSLGLAARTVCFYRIVGLIRHFFLRLLILTFDSFTAVPVSAFCPPSH